jgi:hypothetical protein
MSLSPSQKLLDQAQSKEFTIVDQTSLCVECLDHRAALKCLQCDDNYCDLCFAQQHRFGFRALHQFEMLEGLDINNVHLNTVSNHIHDSDELKDKKTMNDSTTTTTIPSTTTIPKQTKSNNNSNNNSNNTTDYSYIHSIEDIRDELKNVMIFYPGLKYRLQYIPLRLNEYERKLLQILESSLNISEYTDKVDVLQQRNREEVIKGQIVTIFNLISALFISGDFKKGVRKFLTPNKNSYSQNSKFFQHVFEIGRRHKIRNPDKLRSGYGKLMAICADSKLVRGSFGFDLAVPIRSVSDRFQQWGITDIITDPLLPIATSQLDVQITGKELLKQALEVRNYAMKCLTEKYSKLATEFISQQNYAQISCENFSQWDDDEITPKGKITPEDINLLLSSISDAHNYLFQCFTPLDKMSKRLEKHFRSGNQVLPIDIRNGVDGSRLSHSTDGQYMYIHQTYYLWRQVTIRMYPLWYAADHDLLCGYTRYDNNTGEEIHFNPIQYSLRFTDQGITRMQSCPQVGRIMSEIMQKCFEQFPIWHGSQAVHLGDINVPNAFSFIDKYTQLERILGPLDRTLYEIESAWENENHPLHGYVWEYFNVVNSKNYEGFDKNQILDKNDPKYANMTPLHYKIMQDYFRHAFNGSGADNYNSAGSCIDGRLTSSWEWCNIISKKAYHQAFLITGFIGWDG